MLTKSLLVAALVAVAAAVPMGAPAAAADKGIEARQKLADAVVEEQPFPFPIKQKARQLVEAPGVTALVNDVLETADGLVDGVTGTVSGVVDGILKE